MTEQPPDTMTDPIPGAEPRHLQHKECAHCNQLKPLSHFLRRTGKRSGKGARRGACLACRKQRKQEALASAARSEDPQDTGNHGKSGQGAGVVRGAGLIGMRDASHALAAFASAEEAASITAKRLVKRPLPTPPPKPQGPNESVLRATREGIVRMRGRTNKGRRWQQETDLETAVTLVREHAAVVVNTHTIRRIYTTKSFRHYILTRDQYTCFFCGEYGDTIDHLLPRTKGGHTTPINCVCACNICNQSKAAQSVDDFLKIND